MLLIARGFDRHGGSALQRRASDPRERPRAKPPAGDT